MYNDIVDILYFIYCCCTPFFDYEYLLKKSILKKKLKSKLVKDIKHILI